MTEDVRIESFGPGIKGWATEETLAKILSEIKGLSKLSEKQLKSLGNNIKGASGGNTDDFKSLTKAMNDFEDSLEEVTDELDDTEQTISKYNKTSAKTNKTLKLLDKGFSGLVSGLSLVAGSMFGQVKQYSDAIQSGMALSGGFNNAEVSLQTFIKATGTANIAVRDMISLQKEYGAAINYFGMNSFANASKNISKHVIQFGIASLEASQLLASWADTQRILGIQSNLTNKREMDRAKSSIETYDKWSKILGKSAAEIQQMAFSDLKVDTVAAYLQDSSKQVVDVFQDIATTLAGTGVGDKVLAAIANPITALSELSTELYKVGPSGTAAVEALKDLSVAAKTGNKALTEQMLNNFMKTFSKIDTQLAQQMGQTGLFNAITSVNVQLQQMAAMSKVELKQKSKEREAYANITNTVTRLSKVFEQVVSSIWTADFTSALSGAISSLSKSLEDNSSAITKSLGSLVSKLGDGLVPFITKTLPVLIDGLSGFTTSVVAITKKTNEWLENTSNDITTSGGVGSYLGDKLVVYLKESISGMDWGLIAATIGGAIAIGLTAMFASAKIFGAATAGIGKGVGGGISSLLEGIGKGVGKGVGGILTGLATGLKAFANPQVAIGGVALGAVIAALGAGVAGATWLISGTLEKFANGIRHIETLDGNKLTKIGQGIKDLGLGLLGLGAGNLANTISGIGSSISSLVGLGGDSPFDLITKFANSSAITSGGLLSINKTLAEFAPNFAILTKAMAGEYNFDLDDFADDLDDIDLEKIKGLSMGLASISAIKSSTSTTMKDISSSIKDGADHASRYATNIKQLANQFTRLDSAISPELYKMPLTTTVQQPLPEIISTPAKENSKIPATGRQEQDEVNNSMRDSLSALKELTALAARQLDELTKIKKHTRKN